MKVKNFIEKFTINPIKDIEPHFKLTKKIVESSAWTGVQYCWACNHLNVIYFQDRMGGSYTDIIKCFTEN